jgi:hypothetical protein
VPDLQLRELLGDRCTPRLREPVFDAETREEEGDEEEGVAGIKKKSRVRLEKRRLPETCKVSLGDRARFESVVKQVDVLGTTDQFDLFLMQLADKTGIQHLEYSPSNEKKKSGVTTEFSVLDETAASERSELSVSFQAATVNDRWAYELVAATRDARVAAEDGSRTSQKETCGAESAASPCGLRARVEAFTSLTETSGERTLKGGVPPQSTFMFANADASRAGGAPIATPKDWVRPDFYVSPPACKGFNTEFAGLVFKNDTRFKCDRGCSFDE